MLKEAISRWHVGLGYRPDTKSPKAGADFGDRGKRITPPDAQVSPRKQPSGAKRPNAFIPGWMGIKLGPPL